VEREIYFVIVIYVAIGMDLDTDHDVATGICGNRYLYVARGMDLDTDHDVATGRAVTDGGEEEIAAGGGVALSHPEPRAQIINRCVVRHTSLGTRKLGP